MKINKHLRTLLITILTATSAGAAGRPDPVTIKLDPASAGREFEGWGTLSAGATSVFLRDYPEPYRSDILDYLFKPKFGLNIQHLKVEIGSGIDSTCGSEPSHVITPEELENPVPRGYELWLAAEARKRNPDIMLDALPWGTPYWTKDYTTKEAADWTVAFLDVAKKHYGLDFQYIGGSQNELLAMKKENAFGAPFEFVKKHLRPALDKAGYQDVQIQMADHFNKRHGSQFKWRTTIEVMKDPELARIVPVIGYHYPVGYLTNYLDSRPMPEGFLETGIRHWASEDYSVNGGGFAAAHNYMGKIIREYDELRMTKSIAWAPFSSVPRGYLWNNVGFLDASNCWNGYYAPRASMWCMAQLTQFADPGWIYLDSAVKSCGDDQRDVMHMALMAPNKKDWSLIAVTGTDAKTFEIRIAETMSGEKVHVWKSDVGKQMVKLKDLAPKDGAITLELAPESIYTLTTTTGQLKGEPPHPIPPAVPGGPWKDDLAGYKVHDKVKYWGDYEGTFEIAKHEDRNVMKQMVPEPGCKWHKGLHGGCFAIYGGCDSVVDFTLKADVMIQSGHVKLGGRRIKWETLGFQLSRNGDWEFPQGKQSGKIENFNPDAWHAMEFRLSGGIATGLVDGKQLFEVRAGDKKPMTIALSSSYDPNMFRAIEVTPVTRSKGTIPKESQKTPVEP